METQGVDHPRAALSHLGDIRTFPLSSGAACWDTALRTVHDTPGLPPQLVRELQK